MLRSLKNIIGYEIKAKDSDIGVVHDFLFSDDVWLVRYLVVDTSKWLPGRKVIIPPDQFDKPDWEEGKLPVSLTKQEIKEGPSIDEAEPVSRQHEGALHEHFNWRPYWSSAIPFHRPIVFPTSDLDYSSGAERRKRGAERPVLEEGDPHLRSVEEVAGYRIEAPDGEIGHIDELIAEDDIWEIRYAVVDTRNWLPGKKVLLAVEWIDEFKWAEARAGVDLSRKLIEDSPEFDPKKPVNRDYEEALYDYYGRPRPKYWDK
jgi:hypothetical protein